MFDLGQKFSALASNAANSVLDVVAASSPRAKQAADYAVRQLVRQWGQSTVRDLFTWLLDETKRNNAELLTRLPETLTDRATLDHTTHHNIARSVANESAKYIDAVGREIESLASQAKSGQHSILRQLTDTSSREPLPTNGNARKTLSERIIRITCADAKTRSYDAQNYGELLQDSAAGDSTRHVATNVAERIGTNLFQVNNRPSTIHDFCTALAGLVYTTGDDPRVYPVSALPGGRHPPWHPRCHHFAIPLVADDYTDAELREMSQINPAFIDAMLEGADFHALNKIWLQKSPAEWGIGS